MSTITKEDVAVRHAVRTMIADTLNVIASDPEKYRPYAGDELTDFALTHAGDEGDGARQASGGQGF
jgi:hypothetical protein